jgi:hypothetical protein
MSHQRPATHDSLKAYISVFKKSLKFFELKKIYKSRQYCKTGTVHAQGILVGRGRVNEEDEGEGIWLMYIIYMK